jgi:hypothetical protein
VHENGSARSQGTNSGLSILFEALYRGDPEPELMDSVWRHGPGFLLENGGSSHDPGRGACPPDGMWRHSALYTR